MRKIIFLSFFLSLFSFSYGQGLEISSIISVDKKNTVDALFVEGSANIMGPLYLGLPFESLDVKRPFQMQRLTIYDALNISKLYSGRDVLFSSAVPNFDSVSVNSGSLYTIASRPIGEATAGIFRAYQIPMPDISSVNLQGNAARTNNQISANNITLANGSIPFDSPFQKGSEIHLSNTLTPAYTQLGLKYIYYPWEDFLTSAPSLDSSTYGNMCNSAVNNLCKDGSGNCKECERGSLVCHDVRSLEFSSPVFDANGANYTKVGSIKFYCRLNNNQCQKYMVATIGSDTPVYREEFFDQGWSFPGSIDSTSNIGEGLKSPAEKCFEMCNSNSSGCSADQDFYFAVNAKTGHVIDLDDEYTSDNLCGSATTNWAEGSGLRCQAKEQDIDLYKLTCRKNSGKLRQAAGTYYQYRRVDCQPGADVRNEYSTNDYTKAGFLYTDFPKN